MPQVQVLPVKKTYPAIVVEIADMGIKLPFKEGMPDKYSHKMKVRIDGRYFPDPVNEHILMPCQFTTDAAQQFDVYAGQSTYIHIFSYSRGEANVKIGNSYEAVQLENAQVTGPGVVATSATQINGRSLERISIVRCMELALLNFSRKGNFPRKRVWEWALALYHRYNGYFFEPPAYGTEIIRIDLCAEMAVNYGKSKGLIEEKEIGEIGIAIYELVNNMSYKY